MRSLMSHDADATTLQISAIGHYIDPMVDRQGLEPWTDRL